MSKAPRGTTGEAPLHPAVLHQRNLPLTEISAGKPLYGPSAGHPNADALLEDAVRIHDEVIDIYDPDHIVAIGFSVGAGPAAHLASHRALAGMVGMPLKTRLTLAALRRVNLLQVA